MILATENEHKLRELRTMVGRDAIHSPKELGIEYSFEETGSTFTENAWGKALALWKALPQEFRSRGVMADDSGLCVDALGGQPGLYSARFGNRPGQRPMGQEEKNRLILAMMEGETQRRAYYVCSLVFLQGPERFVVVQETMEGEIAMAPSAGNGGFGYDPIFYLPSWNCTVADISDDEKHRISHRGKALNKMLVILDSQ